MGKHERPNKKARERYRVIKEIAQWIGFLLSVISFIHALKG